MKNSKGSKKNFNIAKIFILLFVLFLSASFLLKVFLLYKNSGFDGKNRYTLKLNASNSVYLLSFSPITENTEIIKVSTSVKENLPNIAVDSSINCNCEINRDNLTFELGKIFLRHGFNSSGLTVFDGARLFLFSRSLPASSISENTISEKTDPLAKKQIEESSFIDSAIAKEGLRIEVLNASDIPGLGNKVATIISNAGGSVVMVQNAEKKEERSYIYYSEEEGYTVKKLSNLLNLKRKKIDKKGIADVKIILGKNMLNYFE